MRAPSPASGRKRTPFGPTLVPSGKVGERAPVNLSNSSSDVGLDPRQISILPATTGARIARRVKFDENAPDKFR